jgi:uncharacterized protein YlxP (DUF503 family)
MHVAVLKLDLHIPQSRSLKAKRAVVKPMLEGIRHRWAVAVAEVDHQDQWQRIELGVAVVTSKQAVASEVLDAVERFVWSNPEIEVLAADRTWVDDA